MWLVPVGYSKKAVNVMTTGALRKWQRTLVDKKIYSGITAEMKTDIGYFISPENQQNTNFLDILLQIAYTLAFIHVAAGRMSMYLSMTH